MLTFNDLFAVFAVFATGLAVCAMLVVCIFAFTSCGATVAISRVVVAEALRAGCVMQSPNRSGDSFSDRERE